MYRMKFVFHSIYSIYTLSKVFITLYKNILQKALEINCTWPILHYIHYTSHTHDHQMPIPRFQ